VRKNRSSEIFFDENTEMLSAIDAQGYKRTPITSHLRLFDEIPTLCNPHAGNGHPKSSYFQQFKMTDRRRINGPPGGTAAPNYSKYVVKDPVALERPTRTRAPNVLRKMCMYRAHLPNFCLTLNSLEDRRHTFSFWICISRT
jgi:hypothetical protein